MLALCRRLLLIVLLLPLVACEEDDGSVPMTEDGRVDLLVEQREACERRGGRWGTRSDGSVFACFEPTRDANQPCAKESDCDGLCLARSRTCAPIKPFLGCHEVLTTAGLPATVCRD